MTLRTRIILTIAIGAIGFCLGRLIGKAFLSEPEREYKAGQTWRLIINDENPFEKPYNIDKKIIAVKGDYILYIRNGRDTLSDNKLWFDHYQLISE